MADVALTEVREADILYLEGEFARTNRRNSYAVDILDPVKAYKEALARDQLDTLVSYEEVKDIALAAEDLYKTHLE